jgi:hypothetical protein
MACARCHPLSIWPNSDQARCLSAFAYRSTGYADDELPDLAAYIRRHHSENGSVEKWLRKFIAMKSSTPTGQRS